ncbi:MAG: NnrU family protein [Betaproteobacteria bacterium]
MTAFILGLVLFLGGHSLRIFADGWRTRQVARLGEMRWKGLYTVVSLAGFALLVWGFALVRHDSPPFWTPPVWSRHLAALLTLVAFILIVAAYVPGNHFKTALGHPMVAGVWLWALAHLLANGRPVAVTLFAAFLVWATVDYVSLRRRDAAAGIRYPAAMLARTALATVVGALLWAAFAMFLHAWLIGVRPFG